MFKISNVEKVKSYFDEQNFKKTLKQQKNFELIIKIHIEQNIDPISS